MYFEKVKYNEIEKAVLNFAAKVRGGRGKSKWRIESNT
jgi:hypothetical protein